MSKENEVANWREFVLFWVGFLVLVIGTVSIVLTISGVLIDVLSYRCWYPVLSPLMGMSEPVKTGQSVVIPNRYYCYDPMVAVIRFVFNVLAELVVVGAGVYMMLNGKKR